MIGAILGDMIGSPYEFDRSPKTKEFPLFSKYSQFTDDSVMTVSVNVDAVHIDGIGIAFVEIEGNALDREIGNLIEGNCILRGILHRKIADFEILYVIEKHSAAIEFTNAKILGLLGIGDLLHIVAVPNSAAKLNVFARGIGGIIVDVSPEVSCERKFINIIVHTLGIIGNHFVFNHHAV